jgi:hypothetical protein
MVWHLFAVKLETGETKEGVAQNYVHTIFLPDLDSIKYEHMQKINLKLKIFMQGITEICQH